MNKILDGYFPIIQIDPFGPTIGLLKKWVVSTDPNGLYFKSLPFFRIFSTSCVIDNFPLPLLSIFSTFWLSVNHQSVVQAAGIRKFSGDAMCTSVLSIASSYPVGG
jgi:hypothetical protein